jgi:hypothetical protein
MIFCRRSERTPAGKEIVKRSWAGRLVAIIVVAGAVPACVRHVEGRAELAYSVVSILPTDHEMSVIVRNGLSNYGFQPFVGGLEVLPNGFRDDSEAAPIACVGVTDTLTRRAYDQAPVVEAARQSYFNPNPGVGVSGADVGIVRLTSDENASQLFATMTRAWQACSNTTVVKRLDPATNAELLAAISSVAVTGPLLTATVITQDPQRRKTSRYARALGVRSDCIVEASVAVTPLGHNSPIAISGASDVVRLVQAKVGPK